ncbi:amino acid ABC transporter permease [Maribrevibacterium harenarium]|uniref:Amino acid ABC transporter permease n=1 Tax=Maribrevibacterium harenarium TaxID=2589817 RepID=A0A501WJD5_9GAMM|nr:amino acid ABC transporter permease [Maribrevibacterium harenarium]TPE49468.1 amino acid ABC transporter permease [Maribrevibacterium harenarium]
MSYTVDFLFLANYWDALLNGLMTTLGITGLCLVLGLGLGFVVALMRLSQNVVVRSVSTVYVEFFRGTPVLIQLFWIFFCLPLVLGIEIGNFMSAVIALTLYMGAIVSETFRSSLRAIEKDQMDACVALGIGGFTKVIYVILPQAILRAIPTLLSNSVSLFKESALVSAVGMSDLMYIGQNISSITFKPVEMLTAVAVIYFLIAFPLTRSVSLLERKLIHKISL